MQKNMGTTDRVVRTTAATIIGLLLVTGQIPGLAATILGVLAVTFLATSLISFCPLYLPFRISTKKETTAQAK